MNLINKTVILLTVIMSITVNAQTDTTDKKFPYITIIGSDTVMIYSIEQARELADRNERLKECSITNKICEDQLDELHIIIDNQEDKIDNYQQIIEHKDTVITNKDELINICEEEKLVKDDEISRQKKQKYAAIGCAVVMGILAIVF